MKKFMISFAALAIVVSCTTEKLSQDISAEESAANGTVVTLTANLPALTKATVDDKAFSWSAGDKISLPSNKGEAIFTTTNGDGIFTCTLSEGEELVSGTAKYPATTPGTSFSSIEDAKKAFMMEADYTVGDKSISFNHKSAIVKVSFTNVPSFATGLKVTEGETVVATIALSSPSENVDFFVPITPNGSKKYTFALMAGTYNLKQVSKTVELLEGTYYSTPNVATPVVLFVSTFTGWNSLHAYVYYDNGNEGAWPGAELTGDVVSINSVSYYPISVSSGNVGKQAHVILNAGDSNLAKAFTRIETDAFETTSSKLIDLVSVSQSNLVLYFRDDEGQNNNWGNYYIYGWYTDDTKIFGDWPGWSKNATSFSWQYYEHYGQSNNWIASYTFTGKPAINLILHNNDGKQTADINLAEGKDNWLVVSNNVSGNANTESFPTVSVSVK